jgi:predicted DNA-binding transcriptional regulator AlpA
MKIAGSMKRPRGRPKLTADAQKFREEIARELNAAITSRKLKVKAAAEALGVSRQAFYQYLSATATPHPETIARAMDLWNIEPSYRGEKITRGALGDRKRHSAPPLTQLSLSSLFDVPQECHNENLVVTVQSSRNSVLHVTIKMKKAEGPTPRRTRGGVSKAR